LETEEARILAGGSQLAEAGKYPVKAANYIKTIKTTLDGNRTQPARKLRHLIGGLGTDENEAGL
jgi:hypothetical protein